MDAQAQNSVCASEKEQLNAPHGWTKKLIPARAKNITLRKYDVIFIAPDGQEVKSKWHLHRYLKAHPQSPAFSEFIWSSGEETPIRRSARFATTEDREINKSASKKKGKRNASEMDAEEKEEDQVKTPARKRAKNADKPAGTVDKRAVEDEVDVPEKDEVMSEVQDEAIPCDNEGTQDAAPASEVHKDESNDQSLVDVDESKVAVIEKAIDEELENQVEAENTTAPNATNGGEQEECKVKEVKEQVEAAIIETASDSGLTAEVEEKGAPEISPPVAPSDGLMKDGDIAMESEKPLEHADDNVGELKEPVDKNFEVEMDISYKVVMETSVVQEASELEEDSGKPLEPLMQKEEQERLLLNNQNSPLRVEHTKEKGPSEFSSSSVPVSVANQ